MTGKNGYLYGRGTTDNKGPIIAVAFAAAALLSSRQLAVDLVFLIEGEEESGSCGFEASVQAHKVCRPRRCLSKPINLCVTGSDRRCRRYSDKVSSQ